MVKLLIFCSFLSKGQTTNFGVQFSNAIITRYQPTIDAFGHNGWDHANSIILHGIEKTYLKTKNPEYLKYIKNFVDTFVDEKGNVKGLKTELDGIHPGLLCLFLYETTKENKYKTAAANMKNYLVGTSSVPTLFHKTPDGGYWHKNNDHYQDVMTVDGVYMANPFLLKYGVLFGDSESVDVAMFQTFLAASRMFNIETNLPYHGWDYNKQKSWASPITGTASEVWSRNAGWFSMALADMLESLPPTHKDYKKLLYLYQQLAIGIKNTQNKESLWCQLINHKELADNYTETSGSGMIIYALKKGLNYKWLDDSYVMVVENGWKGLKKYITVYSDGKPQIKSFCPGMGIKNNIKEYLAVRPVDSPSDTYKNQPHGYCAVLMAASVMEN
ncbi:MAG: glycoside hydrolase family 88 protein [Bacteroidota bacterium]